MGMSAFYGTTDEGEALATIDRALELGCNFLDTAEMYGPFKNEELLGKAIAGRRDDWIVATKWGVRFAPTTEDPTNRVLDGSLENARNSIEGSLKRLGTDHVDLWYLHRVDFNRDIEETVGAMAEHGQGGQGAPHRTERGGAGDAAPRARGPSDHGAADRVFAVDARRRGRDPADLPRAWHRLRALLAARPRLPVAAASSHRTTSTRTTSAATGRASRARRSSRTCSSPPRSRSLPPRRAARPASSRWPGCWRRATTSSPSRGRSAAPIWKRTWRPPTSSCPRTTSRASTRRCPAAAGDRYDRIGMMTINR